MAGNPAGYEPGEIFPLGEIQLGKCSEKSLRGLKNRRDLSLYIVVKPGRVLMRA